MAFRILVCAKQVPDSEKVKIDFKTGNLIRSSADGIMNKDDQHALSKALEIRREFSDVTVTVLTMGPPEAEDVLFECIAKGADRGVLLSDRSFAGADTWATSNTLKAACDKLGGFDLILTGRQASDGDTAQVGPQLAEKLGIPHVSYVEEFKLSDDLRSADVKMMSEDGYEFAEVSLPVLCTCSRELNEPVYMTMKGIFKDKDITVWNAEDLGISGDEAGLTGSKTLVLGTYGIAPKQPGFMVPGNNEREKVKDVIARLKGSKVI